MTNSKFHAIVLHSKFPTGQEVELHTQHRSIAAAARSLSKGITASRKPGPSWNTYCAVVCPTGEVKSLRQSQGKEPGVIHFRNLCDRMREVANS